MKNNPIRKRHVGWTHSWSGDKRPTSVKEWVAICPKCNVPVRSKSYSLHYNTKNTRKSAKDALHHHIAVFH
jgi:hypothetical protein